MKPGGAHVWYFPDGYLPEKVENSRLEPHEALMVLNTGSEPASIELDFYFEDREPVEGVQLAVPARRIKCFRMDHPGEIGGVQLRRLQQYALRFRSDVEVIVQYGRMDVAQDNLAYIGMMGHAG